MNAVGIDVSKGKSMVAVLRPLGEVVAKPFEVVHTAAELGKLSDFLKSLEGETKVIMEHTGRYYEPVAQVIHDRGLSVSAVNPLLIREYGGNSLRRVKTDKADAKKIARYGLDNWAELREYTHMDTIRYELKTLNRQFHLASKNRTACSNNLVALLEQSLSGVRGWFDSPVREDGSQKWVEFAMTFWHVDCIRSVSQAAFSVRYRKWCKRNHYNFSAAKAEEIHLEAKETIALVPKSATTKLMIQEAASQLLNLSRMVEVLRAEMNRLAAQLPEYPVVMGMYGVGESIGPQLMAEIGDIQRFAGKQSLVAFAGIDPMPN
jgi:transposase